MPFENPGGAQDTGWLTSGLPGMLVTGLGQTPGLDVIGSQRIDEILQDFGCTERAGRGQPRARGGPQGRSRSDGGRQRLPDGVRVPHRRPDSAGRRRPPARRALGARHRRLQAGGRSDRADPRQPQRGVGFRRAERSRGHVILERGVSALHGRRPRGAPAQARRGEKGLGSGRRRRSGVRRRLAGACQRARRPGRQGRGDARAAAGRGAPRPAARAAAADVRGEGSGAHRIARTGIRGARPSRGALPGRRVRTQRPRVPVSRSRRHDARNPGDRARHQGAAAGRWAAKHLRVSAARPGPLSRGRA